MNYLLLVSPGLEDIALQEVQELVKAKGKKSDGYVEFASKTPLKSTTFQSCRRLLLKVGIAKSIENISVADFPWHDFLAHESTFTIEIENVHGQDARTQLSKHLAMAILETLKSRNIVPKLQFRHPQRMVVIYFTGKEYVVGLDVTGKELNAREYRVFPHAGMFRGDAVYFFVRTSGFVPEEKLLVGFAKDGTLAIEAALYAKRQGKAAEIAAFDVSLPNVVAARKNATIAGVREILDINKYALDELDVKYGENAFDRLIFFVTQKDEEKINELYYQAKYILKSKGTLLLIGRKSWEVSVSGAFALKEKGELKRGESSYAWWLLERSGSN